jgi:hypothetical protein
MTKDSRGHVYVTGWNSESQSADTDGMAIFTAILG